MKHITYLMIAFIFILFITTFNIIQVHAKEIQITDLEDSEIQQLADFRTTVKSEKRVLDRYQQTFDQIDTSGLNIINPIAQLSKWWTGINVESQRQKTASVESSFKALLNEKGVHDELDQQLDEIDEKAGSWEANYNRIFLMPEAYKKNLLGLKKTLPDMDTSSPANSEESTLSFSGFDEIPDFFDWRDAHGEDYITPVKDQANCGSCWAFAAIAALEGAVNTYFNNPDIDANLSEQDLVSCFHGRGCSGAYDYEIEDIFTNYLMNNGTCNASCFPYTATNNNCSNKCLDWQSGAWKIVSNVSVNLNKDAIKRAIIEYGPLEVGMTVYSDFMSYSGGIYQHMTDSISGYHAVTMVGFGKYDGMDYWIVKNSWDEDWGESGYFRIFANDSGIDSWFAFAVDRPVPPRPGYVVCEDSDNDGYCYWGTGEKPQSGCPPCSDTEVDCDDSDANIYKDCGMSKYSTGFLYVTSEPEGAQVYVKDLLSSEYVYRGTSPLKMELNTGEREISVEKQYYLWNGTTVTINNGITTDLHVNLNSKPRITKPERNQIIRPGIIDIIGTAPGPDFFSYDIIYKLEDSDWSSEGIILNNDGKQTVHEGHLATWDASSITEPQYINIQLSINYVGRGNHYTVRTFFIDPSLMEGWPVTLNGSPRDHLIIGLSDGRLKLIQTHYKDCYQSTQASDISIHDDNSKNILGIEQVKPVQIQDLYSSAAFSDIGNNIPLSNSFGASCSGPSLYIYDSDGSSNRIDNFCDGNDCSVAYARYPSIYVDPGNYNNYIPVMHDSSYSSYKPGLVDLDGNYYVRWPSDKDHVGISFVNADDKFFNLKFDYWNLEMYLNGFNKDGSFINNFPINLSSESSFDGALLLKFPTLIKSGGSSNIAVIAGYFNENEDYQMTDLFLFLDVYSIEGEHIKRVELFNQPGRTVMLRLVPTVSGDMDNDGNSEVVVGFSIIDCELFFNDNMNIDAYHTYYKVINSNGQQIGETETIKGYTPRKMVMADLGRGNPEIIAALSDTFSTTHEGQRIMSFNVHGNKLMDVNLEDYNDLIQGLVVGDIDNDNDTEIVVNYRPRWYNSQPSGFLIYDTNGNLEKDLEKPTTGLVDDYWQYDPIFTDFDMDGKLDIIQQSLFITDDYEYLTKIWAFTLDSEYNSSKLEWPMFLHDQQHTGQYLPQSTSTQFCGNNIREGIEQCDGSDDTACPGLCRANCTCGVSVAPPEFPEM